MKKQVFGILAVAALAVAGLVRGEGATDLKQIGNASIHFLKADSIDAGSLVSDYSTMPLGTAYTITNSARSFIYSQMDSNGTFVVRTNIVAQTITTNANTIGPRHFYGKDGCLLVAIAAGNSVTMAAPGTTLANFTPAHSQVYSLMDSNGTFNVTTNVVAAQTNYVPAATIGKMFTLVSATNMTLVARPTVSIGSGLNYTNFTLVTGSVLTMTPISGSTWKVLNFQP